MDLNKVSLIGNLVKDPVTNTPASGQPMARFSLATKYVWRDRTGKKERADYHNVVARGKLAEIVMSYLKNGDKVYIEGALTARSWKGKDGRRHDVTEVLADELIMLGKTKRESPEPSEELAVEEEE